MKKKLILGGVIVVVIALIAVNLLKKEKGHKVNTRLVERGSVQQEVTGSGQIKPARQIKISAHVAGKIIAIHAAEGDTVQEGQLLAELDPNQYVAEVERAESHLQSAQANEKKAKSDLTRSRELYERNLISQAEFEATQASYESAVSTRKQAEAALKEAKEALRRTQLYATMDGIVTKLNKEKGEMAIGAQFQEDVVMVVSDLSVMEAVIEVDENDVVNVSLKDSAQVEVDAFPDTTFTGIVTEIAHSAITRGAGTQEQVTNFEVTVTLNKPDPRFLPGMSTTVDILTKRVDDMVKVPIQAVTIRDASQLNTEKEEKNEGQNASPEEESMSGAMQEVVFVVQDGRAVAKPVTLGISDEMHYAIRSGLSGGERVITGPFRLLSKTLNDGDPVSFETEREKE